MSLSNRDAMQSPDANKPPPKVSVATVTYNHEALIGEAIDGVLLQDVDFPIEMVIGEDCSTDGTRDVILGYIERHPDLIRLSEYESNLGANLNFRTTLDRCRGEYIALLDGDDYWTSPAKLRMQVELMDAHPEYSMCCHAMRRSFQDESQPSTVIHPAGRQSVYKLSDLYDWVGITASSILLRKSALPSFPPWFAEMFYGDWAMLVLLAERGDIRYLAEEMGVHRVHGSNVWTGQAQPRSEVITITVRALEHFGAHVSENQRRPFLFSQTRYHYELVHTHLDEGNLEKARQAFEAATGSRGYDPRVELLEPMLSKLHLNAPKLYGWLRLDAVYINAFLRRNWHRLMRSFRSVNKLGVSAGKQA